MGWSEYSFWPVQIGLGWFSLTSFRGQPLWSMHSGTRGVTNITVNNYMQHISTH